MHITHRDSSARAMHHLRTLRIVRQATRADLVATQAQAMGALPPDPRPTEAPASSAPAVPTETPARTSRTTFERIAGLRMELGKLAGQREAARRMMEARIELLTARLMARPVPWNPMASALVVGLATAITVLIGAAPAAQPVASLQWPSQSTNEPQLPRTGAPAERLAPSRHSTSKATTQTVHATSGAGPATLGATQNAATRQLGEPQPRPQPAAGRRAPVAKLRTGPAAASPAPASDPLGGLDDCADDPICGI